MSSPDPARLSQGDEATAALLAAYAARTGAEGNDEAAAWRRLQPVLDARLPRRPRWMQTHLRVLGGALTVALGLFVLARSAAWGEHVSADPAAAVRTATNESAGGGGGGAFGSLIGDSRGAGGMEGASGHRRHPSDGV